MAMKESGEGDPTAIDRWEGGVGWIAYPDERMQRASHALVGEDGVWLVDPVAVEGVEDVYGDLGEVAGIVLGLDRHKRDAAALADRYDVAVHVPTWMRSAVESDLQARIETFEDRVPGLGYDAIEVANNRFWKEVALYDPEKGTLLVPEAVGTVEYFCTPGERLGVHPMLRGVPPRGPLGGLEPDRILVGHGAGVSEEAATALRKALSGSRRGMPRLYAKIVRGMVGL